jgi:DNA-binding MarR family transcriptional regulator
MTTTIEGAAQNVSAAERGDLLRRAVQRSLILGEVMRRAVQQLRSELAADYHPADKPIGGERESRPDIGQAQFYVLHFLVKDGPLAVSEIAESCHVSVPAISRMLKYLATNGLIERHIDPANRRVIRVVVTEAGRTAEAAMTRRFEAALETVLSPLTSAELADLITAFAHLERLVALAEGTD